MNTPIKTKPNRGLGRGVDALFLNEPRTANEGVTMIATTAIIPGRYQMRRTFDEQSSKELTESIRMNGVIQPIIVCYRSDQKIYELIAGERRWRAAKSAGLTTIPAVVREISEKQMMLFGLIENLQREDLNCLEEAEGIARIIEEHHLTHEKCAELLAKSRSAITNALRLLDLFEPVKDYLRQGLLEMGHARALLPLDSAEQKILADKIIAEKWSVRDIENYLKKPSSKSSAQKKPPLSPVHMGDLSTLIPLKHRLEEKFGLSVDITMKNHQSGVLSFRFNKMEQFNYLIQSFIDT